MSDLRMPDLNTVIVAGRLARDPELRYTSSNVPYCKFSVAVSRKYREKEETLFLNITAWQKTAEYVGNNLRKGRPVLVVGRLTSNEWEDRQTGQKRSQVELTADRVESLDWEERGETLDWDDRGGSARPATPTQRREPEPAEDYGDQSDIPF